MNNTQYRIEDLIKKWFELDKEIRELNQKIKEKTKYKMKLNPYIMKEMKSRNIKKFNTNTGSSVRYVSHKAPKPVNKQFMIKKLTEYFGNNEHKAKEIAEFLYNNRETYIKQYLRNGSTQSKKRVLKV